MAWREAISSLWSKLSSNGRRIVLEDVEVVDSPLENDELAQVEDELHRAGLYIGTYFHLVRNYTVVPVIFAISWIIFFFLPRILWPLEDGIPLPPHTRSFPHPLPELLLGAALWTLIQSLRYPLYTSSAFLLSLFSIQRGAALIAVALHTIVSVLIRPAGLAILRTRHFMDRKLSGNIAAGDAAFRAVWSLALGWALAEGTVAIVQGYQNIGVYRDVLVSESRVNDFVARHRDAEAVDQPLVVDEGDDLDSLIAAKTRTELQEGYGIPAVYIPTFVPVLQRVASICLTLGWTCLLASAYLRSSLSMTVPSHDRSSAEHIATSDDTPLAITLPIVLVLHFIVGALHTPSAVQSLGIHTVAYIGLVIGLAALFAGLGVWGVLI